MLKKHFPIENKPHSDEWENKLLNLKVLNEVF